MALGSGFGSALFHILLKAHSDRLALRAATAILSALVSLPVAITATPTDSHLWSIIVTFALFSGLNALILNYSYQLNDFSSAYPIARGIVPLAMAPLGILFLGDSLNAASVIGIIAIASGILMLSFSKAMTLLGIAAAILTGVTTIGYNLTAAQGMRLTSNPFSFIAWLFVADGILIPMLFFALAQKEAVGRLKRSFTAAFQSSIISLIAFPALVLAMSYAPLGAVSALRETSVLIGLVFAVTMLNERIGMRRIAAAVIIVLGAICIIFAKGI